MARARAARGARDAIARRDSAQLRAAHSYLKDVAARVEVAQARRVAQAAEAGEKVAGQCEGADMIRPMCKFHSLLLRGDSVRARFVAGTASATPLLSVSIRRLSAATASSSARPVHSALTTSAVVTARVERSPSLAENRPERTLDPADVLRVGPHLLLLSHGRDRGGGWSFSSASASASSEHGCA